MAKKKHARQNVRSAFVGKKTKGRVKKRKLVKRKKVLSTKTKVKNSKPKKVIKKKIKLRKKVAKRKDVSVRKAKAKKAKKLIKTKKTAVKRPAKKKIVKKIVKKTKQDILKKTKKLRAVEVETFSPEALFKAKIKVVGVGGGGGSIVSEFGRSLQKASFVIADTDVRALKRKPGIKYFWFGQELTHGLGTGVDIDLAKKAAESAKEKIGPIFKDQDIVIFVASLGGGLGSGATQVFADVARSFGGITLGIFTLPFKFEGKNKYRIAQNALRCLRQSLNASIVIPNERIFKVIDESTPIINAFSIVNKTLIESLESLIELIYNPGIINIDFADLRVILNGRGASAFLNTVEAVGGQRVDKICENILKNPLLQNVGIVAEKILFNIEGSDKLSMFEVEKISSHISAANPRAKIIFGISKNQKLKNKIKTTILMTSGQVVVDDLEQKQEKSNALEKIAAKFSVKQKTKETTSAEKKNESAFVKKVNKAGRVKGVNIRSKKIKRRKKIVIEKKPVLPEKTPVAAEEKFVPAAPFTQIPTPTMSALEQRKIDILEIQQSSAKKAIRRSGLEIKKAEELAEKRRIAQEKEWEIPAFLRKVKFKS